MHHCHSRVCLHRQAGHTQWAAIRSNQSATLVHLYDACAACLRATCSSKHCITSTSISCVQDFVKYQKKACRKNAKQLLRDAEICHLNVVDPVLASSNQNFERISRQARKRHNLERKQQATSHNFSSRPWHTESGTVWSGTQQRCKHTKAQKARIGSTASVGNQQDNGAKPRRGGAPTQSAVRNAEQGQKGQQCTSATASNYARHSRPHRTWRSALQWLVQGAYTLTGNDLVVAKAQHSSGTQQEEMASRHASSKQHAMPQREQQHKQRKHPAKQKRNKQQQQQRSQQHEAQQQKQRKQAPNQHAQGSGSAAHHARSPQNQKTRSGPKHKVQKHASKAKSATARRRQALEDEWLRLFMSGHKQPHSSRAARRSGAGKRRRQQAHPSASHFAHDHFDELRYVTFDFEDENDFDEEVFGAASEGSSPDDSVHRWRVWAEHVGFDHSHCQSTFGYERGHGPYAGGEDFYSDPGASHGGSNSSWRRSGGATQMLSSEVRAQLRSLGIEAMPASASELKLAYQAAAKRFHPDMVTSSEACPVKFQGATQAYQALRAHYS